MADWTPPHCRHGRIILGCPHDDCPEQNAYLAGQQAAIDQWEARQREAARRLVRTALGLPASPGVAQPHKEPDDG